MGSLNMATEGENKVPEEAPQEEVEEPEVGEIWQSTPMADHFENIQKLPDPVDGCPNFRRVPGYKVYCCGQPTVKGFEAALNKVCGDIYPKDGKIIWFNLRQEPVVYVNGEPICARPPGKIGEYAELGEVIRDTVKEDEPKFVKVCNKRAKDNGGKLKYVTVKKEEKDIEVKSVRSLSAVMESLKANYPGLVHMRVPICNSAAPGEKDFDVMCQYMTGTSINTPIIISDQVGLSRATTGCIIACLFKEFQLSAGYDGLVHAVPGVNTNIIQMDRYSMDMKKDALFRGEFRCVMEMVEKLKDGVAAKNHCDKVIDKNGTKKTGGTGIKQLRENIAESKMSYEIMDESAQSFLKTKITDNIHKYFYMIVFSGYMREAGELARNVCAVDQKDKMTLAGGKCAIPGNELKLPKTFVQFMKENAGLGDLIEKGKGNLQWERDIPPEALASLEALAAKDFTGNLGKIIHDTYQTARVMFGDMPQGDHKKRAKYRFASKTLMRILPEKMKKEVEELIEKKTITLDLYEILGQCTWGQTKVI